MAVARSTRIAGQSRKAIREEDDDAWRCWQAPVATAAELGLLLAAGTDQAPGFDAAKFRAEEPAPLGVPVFDAFKFRAE